MAVKYGLAQKASGIPYLVAEGTVGGGEAVLDSPGAVRHFLDQDGIMLARQAEEHIWMIAVDVRSRAKAVCELAHGTIDLAPFSPRMVMTRALLLGSSAANMILAHNHPSGDASPSSEDRVTAKRIMEAGETVGIRLTDFLIVAEGQVYSFLEHGEFRNL